MFDFHNKYKDITVVTYEDINPKYGEIISKRNKVVDIIEKTKEKFQLMLVSTRLILKF